MQDKEATKLSLLLEEKQSQNAHKQSETQGFLFNVIYHDITVLRVISIIFFEYMMKRLLYGYSSCVRDESQTSSSRYKNEHELFPFDTS